MEAMTGTDLFPIKKLLILQSTAHCEGLSLPFLPTNSPFFEALLRPKRSRDPMATALLLAAGPNYDSCNLRTRSHGPPRNRIGFCGPSYDKYSKEPPKIV